MGSSAKEAILAAAKLAAQSRGYNGLNFRELADDIGIKAASIHYHFPSKANLGAALARRYWEDTEAALESIFAETVDPVRCLQRYPDLFRKALETENRMCLCSFMAAEYDDLPDAVKREVQTFADVNVKWLSRMLSLADISKVDQIEPRAQGIFAAVMGAQLLARSRAEISLYDSIITTYREVGLFHP